MTTGPSAVLFDMDGTLLDSEGLWLIAEVEVMERLGSTWDLDDQAHCLGGPIERVARYMVERSGVDVEAADVGRMLVQTVEGHMRREPLTWRPGAREFLRETIDADIPRALVTASWAVLVDALSDRMREEIGVEPFTAVVAGDHITHGKPHPEPYLTAAGLIGSDPTTCLAIEDSPTGVRSARAAGCVVVAIPHIAAIPPDISDIHVIESLEGTNPNALWDDALAQIR